MFIEMLPIVRTSWATVKASSSLPPAKRLPTTRSACPDSIGRARRGMSAGSWEPSASIRTTISPRASGKHARTAEPFPSPGSAWTEAPAAFASAAVRSLECPSMTSTSPANSSTSRMTFAIDRSSLRARITTEGRGGEECSRDRMAASLSHCVESAILSRRQ